MTAAKAAPKPTAAIVVADPDKDYQAEADLRVLAEHHKITKDPKRHAAAKALAKQKTEVMNAIQKQ